MTKVTFCIYDKPDSVGGPVTWVQRLLPALRDHGIEARCLFLLHWGDTGPALSALRSQGFDCQAVLAHERTEDRVRWILDRLRENPPDVFVPNLVVAGYFAARWAHEAGIPTVGVLHSDDDFYRGLQSEFVFAAEAFRVSAVVCVSRELEREVLARRPLATLVRRIPYGVPVPPTKVERTPQTLRIAFVGRLAEEQKRISDVTRALCKSVREVPGTEAVIYGDGPDRAAVERILATEGAGLEVRLEGRIASEEVQQRLLAFDVIVLLSDYEGLPIALMEAMACGCVPVCLRVRSGIPELVEDGVTGLLVGDRGEDFVRAIRRLRDDPDLWQRLSDAARASIAAAFTDTQSAAQWAKLLQHLYRVSGTKRPIANPRGLSLPPVNAALASADVRTTAPPAPVRIYRRGRKFAGRIRRRLSGGPAPKTSEKTPRLLLEEAIVAGPAPLASVELTGTLCIVGVDQDRVLKDFIRAHVEYLRGKKVCLDHWYPEYRHEGRTVRYFYSMRPLRMKLKKLFPQVFYHRWVTRHELSEEAIHDAMAGFFRAHDVDVILAEFGASGADICRHARAAGIPLVVHFHGHDAHRRREVEEYRERYREMFAYAFRIISVSHFMTRALVELGADPARIVYNPYGPRESFFDVQPDYRKTFLALGRFSDIKANYLTLAAFRDVLDACPEAKLVMVGDGELLESCRTLAHVWGIEPSVTFTGAIPHAEVLPLFAEACCFVQHSVTPSYGDAEGTPVAILEAAAAALPVVATRHAGITDAVVHGESGFLVEERDVPAMAAYMCRLVQDPGLCRTMGASGRRHIRSNYSIERHIARLQEAIDGARRHSGASGTPCGMGHVTVSG
jgi:glycosyltransferase involved in cell wall biosynthesis